MEALKGLLKSFSIQPGLTALPEGRAQEYSFVEQECALFLRFSAWVFKGFLRPKASEKTFMKTLLGRMQSLSVHPDLATLPEGRAQEYSSVSHDWALFLRFLAGFMGILGLLWATLKAL